MKTRTRFAPSPTGYMHIGNLRTALYEYLIAKAAGGDFLLRIEDTDQKRYVEGAVDIIYNTLKMVGIRWDEGPDVGGDFGPYVQSERKDIYAPYAHKLVELGGAHYCFCAEREKEYDAEGKVVARGSYLDGLEEGEWEYHLNGEKTEGSYAGGERTGVWKSYWPSKGKRAHLSFKGGYVGGLEDGKHQYFNEDGVLVEEGFYRMGKRIGTWYKYDSNGLLEVSITYDENEEEKRYNGKRTLTKEEIKAYEQEQRRE